MWYLIIIGVVVLIVYSFNDDKTKMLQKIELNGGLKEKYSDFISFFLDRHDFKISEITNQRIYLNFKESDVSMQVLLTQSFGKTLINWASNNIAGSVKMNWEFPDTMNQEQMVEKIMSDVFMEQQENINRKVSKALKDSNLI